ncbi:hypothetical protein ASPBRDRAFT_28586 [Aspergillus brasiliensis CBS 101740]|uniref:Heterokaryon incompatibility domain-containing protein n=1 Tax=Aspergillus brasiliensis (strain CBS 101740 / IMI 381727 / IBT 21946) TaxID=767769 RepID=A0A1L9UP54_ASPBC|nr:hypothetical protein ASPBRDRAFT_28586 [Aspergillus brasiliensis CBS 101740]
MPKHFEYLPLDTERNEIRLLTILPSTRTASTIRCSLKTVSLDDNPSFEAISYVWGDTSTKTEMILDGTTFHVSLSVDRNLRLLRHKLRRRVVWIDYVCINQHDILEKNTQVPLLGRMYASASVVIAMMATDGKNTRAAISLAKSTEQKRITWQVVGWFILIYMSKYSEYVCDLKDMRLGTLYGQIVGIHKDPYWTTHVDIPGIPAGQKGSDLHEGESNVLPCSCGGVGRMTSHRQCKDPRDKVYALYSLLPSLQAKYPPDYNKPVGQVMHETTAYILQNEGLECLISFRLQGGHLSSRCPYPSWVLDLTSPNEHETPLSKAYRYLPYCQKFIPAITDDLSTMTIRARCISVCFPVVQLGSTMPDIIKQLVEVADVHNSSWGDSESRRISLFFACLGPGLYDFGFEIQDVRSTRARKIFDLLQKVADQEAHSITDLLGTKLCGVLTAHAGKTILDINDSLVKGFAISGPDVQQGDVAVMDSGLPAPLVLRPFHENGELYYRLVDFAYIPMMSQMAHWEGAFDDVRYMERPPQFIMGCSCRGRGSTTQQIYPDRSSHCSLIKCLFEPHDLIYSTQQLSTKDSEPGTPQPTIATSSPPSNPTTSPCTVPHLPSCTNTRPPPATYHATSPSSPPQSPKANTSSYSCTHSYSGTIGTDAIQDLDSPAHTRRQQPAPQRDESSNLLYICAYIQQPGRPLHLRRRHRSRHDKSL